jgi:hypothetical protein
MWHKISFLLPLVITGCVNNYKDQRSNNDIHIDSLQKAGATVNVGDTIDAFNKTNLLNRDSMSLKDYDFYQFENDIVLQSFYIHYLKPREILFIIRTKNKKSLNECEYSDTARMASGEGTAQGSDELNGDELYGVYEYFTKKKNFFTIDVEFNRGKRMTAFTKSDTVLCKLDCPLSSKGTLRRKVLSHEKQNNPVW